MNKYHALIFSSRLNYWERSSGAHRIATYLRKHDMDVEVVDFAPYWKLEILKEFTRKNVTSKTLFFGFSVFFNAWNSNMKEFSAWLKKEYPHIKTIAGGQNILQADITNVDIWIDSYGEKAVLEVAKSLSGNTTNGLIFSPEFFGTKKVIKAIHSYPAFNLEDYSIIMEKRDFIEEWEWTTIELARGCKFSCAFCNFPVLGVKGDTSRSASNFDYELRYNYDNFGITRYYLADETVNDRVEKITKFANITEKLNFNTFFSGFIRADLLSQPNMISELARLNLGGQYYGVETFKKESGRIVGKGMCPEKVKQLLFDTREYFTNNNKIYRGTIGLIVGLPLETKEDWKNNSNWLDQNWIDQSVVPFALSVEDLGNKNSNKNNYTNVSKFSENLQKYGLRSMGVESVDRFGKNTGIWNFVEINIGSEEHLWEHDAMNIFEAKEIAKNLRNKARTEYNIVSWELSWPDVITRKKTPDDLLQSSFNVPAISVFPSLDKVGKFIYDYSLKKLNK